MKKKITALILIAAAALSIFSATATANFGSGVEVLSDEAELIKGAPFGQRVVFSDSDFKRALGVSDFDTLKIKTLPKSTEGTLLYAGRRVRENQEIKRKNVGSLVFIPSSKDVAECQFTFTIDDLLGGNEMKCVIKFTDKVNYAPSAKESDTVVFAQGEIAVFGRMSATDPEGDEIKYMVVSYPKYGYISYDKESGKYSYSATDGYIGSDRFAYVARDEYGNFSEPIYVNLEVERRMSEVVFSDMSGREEYTAAVAMTAMGVMSGTQIGDDFYFNPEEAVTRAEFVAMAMKAFGLRPDNTVKTSYFDDNADIPISLVGYVATAQRMGIVNGTFASGMLVFRPNDVITKYEAGKIIAEIMGASADAESEVFSDIGSIPVWARPSVYAMYSLGIFESNDGNVYGNSAVTRANAAGYLYRMCLAIEKQGSK